MFFRRIDTTNRGRINFNEFSNAILPFSSEYAALITDRPDYYLARGVDFLKFFNVDTRFELQALWRTLFKTERDMEHLREKIRKRTNLSLRNAFDFLNRDRDGMVKHRDFRDILAENGFYSTDRELNGLMYRLDRNKDQNVSFQEFSDELAPKLNKGF